MTQDLRLEDVDARVDRVGEHLAPRGLLQESLDPPFVVTDDDAELEWVLHALEADRHRGAALLVEFDQRGEVDVAERVARDDEERVVERFRGQAHRARRAGRRLLDRVLHPDAEGVAVAEVCPDRLRHEREGHEHVVDPVQLQEGDDVLHARAADDRHHRLRLVGRERTQARALTACHDDGLHLIVLATLTTYPAPAITARPTPVQKMASGQSVPAGVARISTIAAYRIQVAALPRKLTSNS